MRLRHAAYLVAASVGARDPVHAELARQLALHRSSGDGLQRAEDAAHAHGVQGQPLAVAERPGDPGDLIVNVILGITVPAGALQPGRDDQPGGLEPARLAPVDPDAVVTAAGDPGPGLQVLKSRPVGPVQDLLEHRLPAGPVRGGLLVACLAGAALVLPDRGVQHRDGLGKRDRHVDVHGGLPGCLCGLAFQLDQPLGGRVRLGRHQPGQVIGEGQVTAAGPAELGPGARVDLPVHRLIWLPLSHLAWGEAEGLRAGSPPAAGRFPILGGVDVIAAGRARSAGLGLGFPDVAEVIALGDGDHHGQPAASSHRDRGAAGPTMII